MDLFHVVEDAIIITRSKGVYKQLKVYRRGDKLFAAHDSGFIMLRQGGNTSHPDVTWVEVEAPGDTIALEGGEFNSPRYLAPPSGETKALEDKRKK